MEAKIPWLLLPKLSPCKAQNCVQKLCQNATKWCIFMASEKPKK
jgi:hypothetical protein